MKPSPNYSEMGDASILGPQLKTLVELQLIADLKQYKVDLNGLRVDWSESCVEGKRIPYMNGAVENFSGISVFDPQDNIVAHGWMEFILEDGFFLAYWEFVTTNAGTEKLAEKKETGLPKHVWELLPEALREKYRRLLVKERHLP
jgi:hypothetical protein